MAKTRPSRQTAHKAGTRSLISRIARYAILWTVTVAHGGFGIYLIAR